MNPKSLASHPGNPRVHFPPQKELASGSTRARRDRGANNIRLTVSESAPVAFAAPIADRTPEAHETSNPIPTRDGKGEGVPKDAVSGQLPGCLPLGYTLDSLLTVEQFAIWRQVAVSTARAALPITKGVIQRSREDVRIHPRSYLENSMKGKR